jgi:excisionase family DNA binding protein
MRTARKGSFANMIGMKTKPPTIVRPAGSGPATAPYPSWIQSRDTSAVGRRRATVVAIAEANDHAVLTIAEVAERLRVSPRTVRRQIASGALCAVKIGRSVRVPRLAVEGLFSVIKYNKNSG